MANEAILMVESGHPVNVTVADGTAITKGAILALTDPNTGIAPTSRFQMCAGIAAKDKIANDGKIQLAVHKEGEFKFTVSGSIGIGQYFAIATSGAGVFSNYVEAVPGTSVGVTVSGSGVVGYSKEAATNGETFKGVLQLI